MGFIALLIGLAVVGLIILGFIAYWVVMAMLIALGVVFVFWAVVFAFIFKDPYVTALCSVFATGLTFWALGTYCDRKKSSGNS